MEYLHIIILAVVQGLTEFLPISSDGHLVVVDALLGNAKADSASKLALNVMLHVGTLAAVVIVYWRRLLRLLGSDVWMLGKLFVAALPVAAVGLAIDAFCPGLATQPLLAGFMLVATGVMLWASRGHLHGTTPYEQVTYRQALVIGLAQALAPLPGLSRSGTTIVGGLMMGLRRDAAATFSFVLSVPVIGGACLLEGIKLFRHMAPGISAGPLAVGVLVSFLVGLAALVWLLRWLARGRLHYFAWYLIPLGCAVVIWQALRWV
jgi:undecaprenyl-diphosphatase